MIKNEFRFEGDTLFIIVERKNGQRIEFKLDSNCFSLLSSLDTKLFAGKRGDLSYFLKRKQYTIKDFLMHFPKNKVTHTNKDNTDLRMSNLKCFGVRNKYWVEGEVVFIEDQNGELFMFDLDDLPILESFDCFLSSNGTGYLQGKFFGGSKFAHRMILECRFGEITNSKVIDHINGNHKDNRKENLRTISHADNIKSRHSTSSKIGFPNVYEINGKFKVKFKSAPERNKTFDSLAPAVKYSFVVRPFVYGQYKGTVGSFDNMVKAIKTNGGRIL